MSRKVEVLANICLIIASVVLCGVLVKKHLLRSSSTNPPASDRVQVGSKLNVNGVDWTKNGKTLLLAVSENCHFCSESAPFYQRLVQARGTTHIVAVLPQPLMEARAYLQRLNVNVDDVKQLSLGSIGVSGTPTLILVGSDGTVIQSWIGKLQPNQEQDVMRALQQNSSS